MQDELNILREIGSIASGHGSTALSDILRQKINLTFPSIDIITPLEVPARIKVEEMAIVIISRILVGLEGEVAVIFNSENAAKLINLSCTTDGIVKSSPGFITELGLSAIKEIGNIIIASYLNALSLLFKKMIIPPSPTVFSGSVEDILNVILATHKDTEYCYLVEAVFEEPRSNLKGEFSLILTPYAASDINTMCRKMLTNGGQEDISDPLN